MPICIECGYKLANLYTTYSKADDRSLGKGVRLTQCSRCKRFADKYVEHDFVVLFIDLVLIKPQVGHLVFVFHLVACGLLRSFSLVQSRPFRSPVPWTRWSNTILQAFVSKHSRFHFCRGGEITIVSRSIHETFYQLYLVYLLLLLDCIQTKFSITGLPPSPIQPPRSRR